VRASELLATVRGTTRTPASIVLYQHYRDLTRAELGSDTVDGIRERFRGRIPAEVLAAEMARLEVP
jgi:hypothetical protein